MPFFYKVDNEIYDISGVYDVGSANCNARFDSNPMDIDIVLPLEKEDRKHRSGNN